MKTLTTLLLVIVFALLGMSFYLNDKIEKLEAGVITADTLNVKHINAEIIRLHIIGSDTVYIDPYKVIQITAGISPDYKNTFEIRRDENWKQILHR